MHAPLFLKRLVDTAGVRKMRVAPRPGAAAASTSSPASTAAALLAKGPRAPWGLSALPGTVELGPLPLIGGGSFSGGGSSLHGLAPLSGADQAAELLLEQRCIDAALDSLGLASVVVSCTRST